MTINLAARTTLTVALLALSCAACDGLDGLGGPGAASGNVQGKNFTFSSGTAETDGRGNYVITLSDASNFNCFSSPSGAYLSIVIAGIQQPGSFSAFSVVTFNDFEGNIINSEAAMSGTVTIDLIDAVDANSIYGSISASGQDSTVEGNFEVEICD